MSRLLLREWEAAAFAAGRKSMLLRPVTLQPSLASAYAFGSSGVLEDERGEIIRPPARVGDELWGAEAWAQDDKCRVVYRADLPSLRATPDDGRWRTAATMPRWAARFVWRVTDVRVVRVGDINEQEAINAGHIGYTTPTTLLRQYWRVDFGKRHPWDANPWTWLVGVEAKHERA